MHDLPVHPARGFTIRVCSLGPCNRQGQLCVLLPLLCPDTGEEMHSELERLYNDLGLISSFQLRLAEPEKIPEKQMILFRYDPAVLIISIWYNKSQHSFGKVLQDQMCLSYGGNAESVGPHYIFSWGHANHLIGDAYRTICRRLPLRPQRRAL